MRSTTEEKAKLPASRFYKRGAVLFGLLDSTPGLIDN
jgi:hypothetical protein